MEHVKSFFYTWLICVVINQVVFFGKCFNLYCIIAAMPHTFIIALIITVLSIKSDSSKEKSKKDKDNKLDKPIILDSSSLTTTNVPRIEIIDDNDNQLLEVIILTKSSKHKGYCIAGITKNTCELIRLVSSHGALFDKDIKYENGLYCDVLDLVQLHVIKHDPTRCQPENVLIDSSFRWKKIGRYSIENVLEILPTTEEKYIFLNSGHNILASEMDDISHSLVFAKVSNLRIYINEYKKIKADFMYNGCRYRFMAVTDPDFYSISTDKIIGNAVLVLSIADTVYHEKYFKLIAKIFPL